MCCHWMQGKSSSTQTSQQVRVKGNALCPEAHLSLLVRHLSDLVCGVFQTLLRRHDVPRIKYQTSLIVLSASNKTTLGRSTEKQQKELC